MPAGARKTALVTGAGARIGRATALALADAGMNVVVHYRRSRADAVEVCRLVEQRGVAAWAVDADFDEPGAPEHLLERALAASGSLEVLVNNASRFPEDDLGSLTFERLVETMHLNAWVPFELCRAFAARVGRGHIVNLLDSRIVDTDRTHVGYLLGKQVLAEMTKLLALELAPDIAVNAVAPGLILPPPGATRAYLDARVETVPLARHGTPAQVARAVVFLAESEFVTGEVVFVDGGRHLAEYEPRR